MARKPLVWIGSALEDLRAFPEAARHEAGYQLDRVQTGRRPADFKPMPSVGRGAFELRIRTADAGGNRAHRVFYVARIEEAIYVLHAFEKKSQKTSARDVETGRRRYQQLLRDR